MKDAKTRPPTTIKPNLLNENTKMKTWENRNSRTEFSLVQFCNQLGKEKIIGEENIAANL